MTEDVQVLIDAITSANDAYYNGNSESKLTDREYDALKEKLKAMLPTHPLVYQVGAAAEGVIKRRHLRPMLSLSNVYSEEELQAWVASVKKEVGREDLTWHCSHKLDGVALCLRYSGGRLEYASTRGDGKMGEDVTGQAIYIRGIRQIVPFSGALEIRGEVIFRKEVFEEINKKLDGKYKNPRNAAAGLLRNSSKDVTDRLEQLEFNAYGAVNELYNGWDSESTLFQALRDWGFTTVTAAEHREDPTEFYRFTEKMRETHPWEIDGIVVKVEDRVAQRHMGARSKSPRWAVAVKFEAQETASILKEIDVQIGRTGRATPVGYIEPVELNGVVLKKASLYNFDYIKDNDIREGDTVRVVRAGDVIPRIENAIMELRPEGAKRYVIPNVCPCCGHKLEQDGKYLQCTNWTCEDTAVNRIVHFGHQDNLDIRGLSDGTIQVLYDNGYVSSYQDLFTLHRHREELEKLEGFGKRSVEIMLAAIENCRVTQERRFLSSLGLPGIGKTLSRQLLDAYSSLEGIYNQAVDDIEVIRGLDGVGEKSIENIQKHFVARWDEIREFAEEYFTFEEEEEMTTNGPLEGHVIVFTGTFSQKRKELEAEAVQLGATTASSVSKRVTRVVAGEKAGSKRAKAQALGIEIRDEDNWRDV